MLDPALDVCVPGCVVSPGIAEYATYPGPERRSGRSPLLLASQTLAHAVEHLMRELMAGNERAEPVREAVALLCRAGRTIAALERRAPERGMTAAWLRSASRVRAARLLDADAGPPYTERRQAAGNVTRSRDV